MEIKKVTDEAFRKYGRVLEGIDFTSLLEALEKTPCPEDVVYVASEPILEATAKCRSRSAIATVITGS